MNLLEIVRVVQAIGHRGSGYKKNYKKMAIDKNKCWRLFTCIFRDRELRRQSVAATEDRQRREIDDDTALQTSIHG